MKGKTYFEALGRRDQSLGLACRIMKHLPSWARFYYEQGWMFQAGQSRWWMK